MGLESPDMVFKRRDRVVATATRVTSGLTVIDAGAVARVSEAVLAVLPSGCRYDAVFRSLSQLINNPPTPESLRHLMWCLASGVADLRAGRPVVPGVIPTEPTPAIIQVTAVSRRPNKSKKKESPVRLRGRVVTGAGCPAQVRWTWSLKFISYVATHQNGLGFIRPKPGRSGFRYQHFMTLAGMRIGADVSMEDGRSRVSSVKCSGGLQEYNRALTAMRWRQTFVCPFSFTHPCHECPKGQNSCPASCRPLDLIDRLCPKCMTPFRFDPTWEDDQCPTCNK